MGLRGGVAMKSPIKVRRLPHEVWAEAYDGYYISNKGRWYSARTNRIMAQEPNSSGYYRISIRVDGKRVQPFTHIKVVEIFGDRNGNLIPPNNGTLRELKLSIDHLNRNKKDNRQRNLEIVTHSENCARKFIKKKETNYGKRI